MGNFTDAFLAYKNQSFLVSFSNILEAIMSLKHVIILVATVCHLIHGVCQSELKHQGSSRTCECRAAAEDSEKQEKQDRIHSQRFSGCEDLV